MTVSSIGEFVTSRGEAIGKRTDVFSDIVIAEGDNGNVIISYVSKMFPDKKPVQLLKIATQESGSDGMSDRTYAAAAYTFLHERVELGGLKFCEVNGLTFLSELQPAELLEFVARSLLAGPRVGDQRLFQFCVMAGQEPTAFRYPSASTQAFWKFGLSFRVHPKIKTWLKISRYFRQIRLFWGIVVGRNT
jgi:hypothetical protein